MSKPNIAFRLCSGLFTLALLLSLSGPVHAACADPLGCVTVGPTDDIHIAYLLSMTGGAANLGIDQERGIQIAIQDSGGQILGHNIHLTGQDGACTESGGAAAAQVLDDDATIVAVIGTSCSSEAIGAMPYLSAAGMSMVSPSNTNSSLTEPGNPNHHDGYLRVSWNDAVQGKVAAQYAYDVLGLDTAATIQDGSGYSNSTADFFQAEFTSLGGIISAQVTIDPDESLDMDESLEDIAAANPTVELLYYPSYHSNSIVYILDNKAGAGLSGAQLMGSDGAYISDINNAANEEGYLLTNYDFTATQNAYYVTDFLPAYQTAYGDPIAPFHAHAYDAFMIIKAAIEAVAVETSSDTHEIGRQALRDALYGTTDHDGLTGDLTCDANGDCASNKGMAVYKFHTDVFPPKYHWPLKIGLVTESAGIADMSFNYMAYQGMLQAEENFDIRKTLYHPTDETQFEAKLQQCADEGNALCISVGFLMDGATQNMAAANPGTNFAIVDMGYETPPANLRGLVFDEKQSGYLAGALAARMSSSGTIGAIGGMEIGPVIRFLEGYQNGAQCSVNNINVLMKYTGTFIDPGVGAAVAAEMIARRADVIFGAAGLTGNGAILYSAQHDVWSIGVDADQYMTVFENGTVDGSDMMLTSAMKRIDTAVYKTIEDQVNDAFTAGTVMYDLAADGVGLAPFHEADDDIPNDVKTYLETVKQDIIAGNINVDYTCNPRFHAQIIENNIEGYDWQVGTDVTMTLDDPNTTSNPDFTDTQTVDQFGTVQFNNLGGLQLEPGMYITMDDGILLSPKTHTVTNLAVTEVNAGNDTISGTGTPDAQVHVQYCDQVGCSWRRYTTVQLDGTWQVNFSVPGASGDEQLNLDIVPGMRGEALEPDEDGDHTDMRWAAPTPPITYRSVGAQDGWVLESSETSNKGGKMNSGASTLNVGDDAANKQYRAVLSFNTAPLHDDAIITKVTLRLKRQGVTGGGNPVSIFKGFFVDIKKGNFGTAALQLTDFQTAPTKTYGPFNTALSSGWYKINLTSGKNQINKFGNTQIRLRFKLDDNNDFIANFLSLYSGNAVSASRPQLIVEYYVP